MNVSRSQPAVLLTLLGILLIACNLRGPITGIGPVLPNIAADLRLSSSALGALTTLPLLAFAFVSPLAPLWAKRLGISRTLGLSLIAIIVGFVLRALPEWHSAWLYIGTALIGAGIAVGNVLLPALVKQRFPERIALLTSVYAFTMGVAAAAASAAMIPLMNWGGLSWSQALLSVIVIPIVTLLVWLPQWHTDRPAAAPAPSKQTASKPKTALWRHALAWQVTLFMGINSLLYYSVITWLPSVLQDASYSAAAAGSIHGLLQLFSALPGFVIVPLMARFNDQRVPALLVSLCSVVGLMGLNVLPQAATVWAALIGFGAGGVIILGLMFMGLRTHTASQAAALSGMAQAVGYLLAAAAPPIFGYAREALGDWHAVLNVLTLAAVLIVVFGFFAGRARKIPQD